MDDFLENFDWAALFLIFYAWSYIAKAFKKLKEKRPTAAARNESPAKAAPPPPRRRTIPQPPAAPAQRAESVHAELRSEAQRLSDQADRLISRIQSDDRASRLLAPIKSDVITPLSSILKVSEGSDVDAVLQAMQHLEAITELYGHLEQMAVQRLGPELGYLGDADAFAAACYDPVIAFARSENVPLHTMTPITVQAQQMSIIIDLRGASVAPLRVPQGFANNLWWWPAIAHEVAHDLYYSVNNLDMRLHERLRLPTSAHVTNNIDELDHYALRQYFGPWLSEIFADVIGTMMLGPAYMITMSRLFRNTESPKQILAVKAIEWTIDSHPPRHLRMFISYKVLHYLGQHDEADDIWEEWSAAHGNPEELYVLIGERWAAVPLKVFADLVEPLLAQLLKDQWPELGGFHLIDIPGLTYLHAEHAKTQAMAKRLQNGKHAHGDPRLIIAAAVLAATSNEALHDQIMNLAHASIIGIGTGEQFHSDPAEIFVGHSALVDELRAVIKSPPALAESIALGAAFRRRHR